MSLDQNDVVQVFTGGLAEVEEHREALLEAGIECQMVGGDLSGSFGSVLPSSVELWVHRRDLAKAQKLMTREVQEGGVQEGGSTPRAHFPHPTNDAKPAPPRVRKEPHVDPGFGS
jgi:hypothetical protein